MDINLEYNKTVACGHRWIHLKNKAEFHYAQGACYWSNINNNNINNYEKLLPLVNEDAITGLNSITKKPIFIYGLAQAGFSVHFSKKKEPEMILGAPGLYNWAGSAIKFQDKYEYDHGHTVRRRRRRQADVEEFGDVNIPREYIQTYIAQESDYNGYMVTSGTFFGPETIYAMSAPRHAFKGKVTIFRYQNFTKLPLEEIAILEGDSFGEYFGASLAAGDFNGDGFDDLVVGSPHYSNSEGHDEGRIQVFYGSSEQTLSKSALSSRIEGNSINSQFGLCVTFLGDIDRDGYNDLAVGAPYENKGSGVVYIFMGTQKGLSSEAAQKLIGQQVDFNIRGFGISIAKPADIDGNGYSDLTIGAYQSGHVVLYRSKKPVVLRQSIKALLAGNKIDLDLKSFKTEICVWFECEFPPRNIKVTRRISVDERYLRGRLVELSELEKTLEITAGSKNCVNVTINLNVLSTADLYTPFMITVSQEMSLLKPPKKTITVELDSYNLERQDEFNKNWPVVNLYKSKNETAMISFALGCKDKNVCYSKLGLEAKFHTKGKYANEYVIGSQTYMPLEIIVSNFGEKAYSTLVMLTPPSFLDFRNISSSCWNSNSSLVCLLANPLDENKSKSITFDFNMREINTGKHLTNITQLTFNVTLLTSSNNSNQNNFTIPLRLVQEADMEINGTSSQEYYHMNITTDSANFTQIFRVQRHGYSPIKQVLLEVFIPMVFNYHGQKTPFLGVYHPVNIYDQTPVKCWSNITYVDEADNMALMLTDHVEHSNETNNNTRQRSTTDEKIKTEVINAYNFVDEKPLSVQDIKYNKTFFVNCSNPQFECFKVTCTVGPFEGRKTSSNLELRMILNASSLAALDLLHKKEIIRVSTYAKITILDPKNFTQTGNKSDQNVVSSQFTAVDNDEGVAGWIIFLAILAGLLLLGLVIFGLIKAGFFKRTQKMELEALKKADANCDPSVSTATMDTVDEL